MFSVVQDDVLQCIKQERTEVGACAQQGRVSGGTFAIHLPWNSALVLTTRTIAVQVFPETSFKACRDWCCEGFAL